MKTANEKALPVGAELFSRTEFLMKTKEVRETEDNMDINKLAEKFGELLEMEIEQAKKNGAQPEQLNAIRESVMGLVEMRYLGKIR